MPPFQSLEFGRGFEMVETTDEPLRSATNFAASAGNFCFGANIGMVPEFQGKNSNDRNPQVRPSIVFWSTLPQIIQTN
jgi:hypothetical protein